MQRLFITTKDLVTGIIVEERYEKVTTYRGHEDERYPHHDPRRGPAIIERHPKTGVVTYEGYWLGGVPHRIGKPAITRRDGDTGIVIEEKFFWLGENIRDPRKGPWLRRYHPKTGSLVEEAFADASSGWRQPKDGPSRILYDWQTGIEVLTEYRFDRLPFEKPPLHRDPGEGPALIRKDGRTGEVTFAGFYLKGRRVKAPVRRTAKILRLPERRTPR
jgi:hypothetical protein